MLSIKEVMSRNVITVQPNTPVYEAMILLTKHKISGLPVVDEQDHLKGILTERDLLRIMLDKNLDVNHVVEEYMTRNVVSFSEDTNALTICEFFINNPIRRVPIIKDGKLIGVISRRDIIHLILEAKSKISDHRFS